VRKAHLWCMAALLCLTCSLAPNSQAQGYADDFPRRVAERCKGEAHFAIAPCGCVVKNRLAAGWTEATVLEAFYAADVAAKDAEVWLIERVLTGYWPCDPRIYFMFSTADVTRLDLEVCNAILEVRRNGKVVYFFAEDALRD